MDNFEKMKSHWYVLQVMSGQENRAMNLIQIRREQDVRDGIDDGVDDIKIPTDKIEVSQKNKKPVIREKKRYPGYVLIQARLYQEDGQINPDVWDLIKNTQGVIGFVGGEHPVMLSKEDVMEMLRSEEEAEQPKPQIQYNVGETVTIKSGAFEGFEALIEGIVDRGRLKVSVNIFGRQTAMELGNDEVEKVN